MTKNESDALLELERVCRIVTYQTVGENELGYWRNTFKTALEKIQKAREIEARLKEARRARKAKEKAELYGGKKL